MKHYYCVECSQQTTQLGCTACIQAALEAARTTLTVNFCHFCGKAINQQGTECLACETRRLLPGRRIRAERSDPGPEQATLWGP